MKTPLALVTGFLGSGKTTLLERHWNEHRTERFLYLVNDFSPQDVDGHRLLSLGARARSISGGSIFCRCRITELLGVLKDLDSEAGGEPGFDGILIEASGIADPGSADRVLAESGFRSRFPLVSVTTIVDPAPFLKMVDSVPCIQKQVECADRVLLNKCDLYPEALLARASERIAQLTPTATIRRCTFSDADGPLFPESRLSRLAETPGSGPNQAFETIIVRAGRGVDLNRIERFVVRRRFDILRMKGCCEVDGIVRSMDLGPADIEIHLGPAPSCGDVGLSWIVRAGAAEGIAEELRTEIGAILTRD